MSVLIRVDEDAAVLCAAQGTKCPYSKICGIFLFRSLVRPTGGKNGLLKKKGRLFEQSTLVIPFK